MFQPPRQHKDRCVGARTCYDFQMKKTRHTPIHPGMKIGRWTALERVTARKRQAWACRCECGTESVVDGASLLAGGTKSCGCARKHTTSPDGTRKWCSGCETSVPLDRFSFMVRRGKTVPRNICRACTTRKNRGKMTRYRLWSVKTRYGLDAAAYAALYERARDACELCGWKESDHTGYLCVDHCHATGKVRGLLCRNCNSALGKLREDPALLEKAARYLRASGPESVARLGDEAA